MQPRSLLPLLVAAPLFFTACDHDGDGKTDAGASAEAGVDLGRSGAAADLALGDGDGGSFGDGGSGATGSVRLGDVVVDAPGATGSGNGDPKLAVNGVRGAGPFSGSTDVYSLGYGANDYITIGWSLNGVLMDGPGADLAVFENPFDENSGGVFMDLIIVEVSHDGATWVAFPHQYAAAVETTYSNDPTKWQGFAGKTPVLLNADGNAVDPFNPGAAGGDEFDLATLPDDGAAGTAVRTAGARYVRLVTAPSQINPDTNALYVHDAIANGADIDGIYGRYVVDH